MKENAPSKPGTIASRGLGRAEPARPGRGDANLPPVVKKREVTNACQLNHLPELKADPDRVLKRRPVACYVRTPMLQLSLLSLLTFGSIALHARTSHLRARALVCRAQLEVARIHVGQAPDIKVSGNADIDQLIDRGLAQLARVEDQMPLLEGALEVGAALEMHLKPEDRAVLIKRSIEELGRFIETTVQAQGQEIRLNPKGGRRKMVGQRERADRLLHEIRKLIEWLQDDLG